MSSTAQDLEIDSPSALWDWLRVNHGRPDGVMLVTWTRPDPRYVGREDVLDALVAHGWTDGRRFRREDGQTAQLISPRRQQAWSASYKARAERLEAEGRMTEAGRAAIAASKAAGLWDSYAAVDALEVPDDLAAAFALASPSRDHWEALPPSYRRNVLRWIAQAKRPPTRARRIADTVAATVRNRRLPQM